jgi:hypothetical protein
MTRPAYSDPQLLEWTINLSKKLGIETFFETGSYHGGSAKIVSDHFSTVLTVENNLTNYTLAKEALKNTENCELILGNSPDILKEKELTSEIFFFLDAHWEDYWPLLDELKVIANKKIKPLIAIHDFYVPDEKGGAKFGYDSYRGQPLNFNYIKNSIDEIYGAESYEVLYSSSSATNSGVIYIIPKK